LIRQMRMSPPLCVVQEDPGSRLCAPLVIPCIVGSAQDHPLF
jgi:hypothetical protein